MVASAIGRSPNPGPVNTEDEQLGSSLRENITRQAGPLLGYLKDWRVLLFLFLLAVSPFGFRYWAAYEDVTLLQEQINDKEALLAANEPPADDIEASLRTWTDAHQAATEAQILELEHSSLIEKLLAAAESTGISVQSMSTSGNTAVPVGTEVYDATPFILRISGEIAAIESFITLLEGDAVEALEIQNTLVAPQEGVGFTGVVRAIVFNRPIDPSELDEDERESLSRRVTDEELDAAAGGGSGRGAQ